MVVINLLSANVEYTPHEGDIKNNDLRVFERGESLLQNGILHFALDSVNHQKRRWKVRIKADEKQTFLRGVWHLKG